MKIGLYFGSFNPIHVGHCIIASYMVQNSDLDQVWLVVSPQNPFKPSRNLLNEYQRLHLAQLAVEGEKNIRVSDIEFHLPRPSYTVDTMAYLKEKFPTHRFSILMGTDGLMNLPKWKNSFVLIRDYSFYVYPRAGFPVPAIAGLRVTEVAAPVLNISSTQIREMIQRGQSVRFLVPDSVHQEIERSHYYK
jgi:nicotinate-nucleotide adenylyltransferase